jgi:predicted O-methyltransferase YrrM
LTFFTVQQWLKYFHLKTDEHSLHSPFFYDFYKTLVSDPSIPLDDEAIETVRKAFLQQRNKIDIQDLGAGSQRSKKQARSIASVASYSSSSRKFSSFLYRLIEKYQFNNILELGTSLGINTAYLEKTAASQITSFEGDPAVFEIAKAHLLPSTKLTLILGNIDQLLPAHLKQLNRPLDLVYIDANHTYEATLNYFNLLLPHHHQSSIFILDDIHWSKGMNKAWEEIKGHPQVCASIDLFDAGLLFFNPTLNSQHLVLDF